MSETEATSSSRSERFHDVELFSDSATILAPQDHLSNGRRAFSGCDGVCLLSAGRSDTLRRTLVVGRRVGDRLSYRYETFLSYRRVNEWPAFVEHTFLPMFRHWLQEELDEPPQIFYDRDRIEVGDAWPHELAEALATSKLMICLWSRQYFCSRWCKAELGHMLARRKALTTATGPPQLIIPVIIHDGDSIPRQLSEIQRFDIREYSSPWLGEGSRKKEELSDRIKILAQHAGHALMKVPEYDPSWMKLAVDEFANLFRTQIEQSDVPSLGVQGS